MNRGSVYLISFRSKGQLWSQLTIYVQNEPLYIFIKTLTQSDMICLLINAVIYRNYTQITPPQGALILFLSNRQLWSTFIAYAHTPTSLQFIFRLKTQSDMICLLINAVIYRKHTKRIPPKVLLTLFPFDLTFDYGHNSQHRHPLIPSTSCIKTSTLSEAIYPLINAIIYR